VSVVWEGRVDGYLTEEEVRRVARKGLERLPVDGRSLLVIIPDGTRTMPMPLMFDIIERELGPRVSSLDFLVALGTHSPMDDAQLSRLVGRPVVNGFAGGRRIHNHQWDDPSTFVELGTLPAQAVEEATGGLLSRSVTVALNRLAVEHDHVLICGPVFPHEVAGFSGGTKYLFPGIAAPEIIHFTHWLGALITSSVVIGTIDTAVRAIIDKAASLLETPLSLLAVVVTHDGTAGVFCGDPHATWRAAASLSSQRHVIWVDEPYDRVLAVMPKMYDDIWTAAKGAYKTEPVVADGGEIIIYAPHVTEVSYVHGKLIEEIGYHCRDYFLSQWDRFAGYPGGILAHSTHVKGLGTCEPGGEERPRIQVALATGISRERCERINLGYKDPASIDPARWPTSGAARSLVVSPAGEQLYRLKPPA
jgi:nickel-dependent lactate racemase